MKVWGADGHFKTLKIVLAGEYAGQSIDVQNFFPIGQPDDVVKDFKKKNPNGKVPVLETPEGCIYESNAILRYVARLSKTNKIYGATKFEQAQVDQWLDWASTVYEHTYYEHAGVIMGYRKHNKDNEAANKEKLLKALNILENHLNGKTYLVGNQVTIADINLASSLLHLIRFANSSEIQALTNVQKWVAHLGAQPEFVKVFGKAHAGKSSLPFYTGDLGLFEAPKKTEKKAAEPKPKQQQPAKKAEKKPKDEDDDDDEPKEKKVANSLDSLPPSSFNLFDFKTLFVNAPNKKEALQFFWDNLDDKGYSVWRMDYEKAEGEGNVTFLTSNLMNGYLQRLETFRKYAFGVCGVYGDEPKLEIRGCWVWRGTEIPFELKDHPSADWYHFKKLDVKNNEADRKIQEEYWCGMTEDESVVEGLTARIIKYYK